ncbi:MAG: EF-P 5-aminopentanol modification-associated protein YfmF [Bacilli bacterium]
MNYKKIDKQYYNLHMIQTDAFKTINVSINFKRKINKEEISFRNFLGNILVNSSFNYKTKKELEIQTEELYNIKINCNCYNSGNYHILSFNQRFLNEKYTEAGMNKKSIEFLKEIVFNPNIENNEFLKESFNLTQRFVVEQQELIKEDPVLYARVRMLEEMEPNSVVSLRPFGYIEDSLKINKKNLYDFYLKMLEEDIVDIYVIGDFDLDEMEQLLNVNINTVKEKSITHFVNIYEKKDHARILKESSDINQSKLDIGFRVEELSLFESQYVINVVSSILGSGGDSKLFKIVREENSLCYHISSSVSALYHLFEIRSGIDGENFDKTFELIKEQIVSMKKGEFTDEDINKAKLTYISAVEELTDSPSAIIQNYISHEYLGYDLLDARIDNINKVTKEMIVETVNKIHLDTIFLLEGSKNG